MPSISMRPGSDALLTMGPTVGVRIGLDTAFNTAYPSPPALSETLYPAIVDTGALESSIDASLATALGLPKVGETSIAGAIAVGRVNSYLAQIHIDELGLTLYGVFSGLNLRAGGHLHYALLGRTFLQNFTMTYGGVAGVVTITND